MEPMDSLELTAPVSYVSEGAALEQFRNELIEKLLSQHDGILASAEQVSRCFLCRRCIGQCIVGRSSGR